MTPSTINPFNLSLLVPDKEMLKDVKPITVLDIFDSAGSKAFHPEGLFSTEIFGKVGDEKRNRIYAYIDLKAPIIHPVVYKALTDMRELYAKIMAGQAYANFDKGLKDFTPSQLGEGYTGYQYFIENFVNLKLDDRGSTSREFSIKLFEKFKNSCLIDKLIVMPAGLRDFTITPSGKPEEDEINNMYRRVLAISNIIPFNLPARELPSIDQTRYNTQIAVNAVYDYLISLLEGKHKLIQGWWTSRKVFRSTRNVITSSIPMSEELFDVKSMTSNHAIIGLYQTMMSIFPITVNCIREVLSPVFPGSNMPANLINPKTLKREQVSITPDVYDAFMVPSGLEKTIARFEVEELRSEEIMVDKHYVAMIYNDGKRVKIVYDPESIPEWIDKQYLKPITYAELYYLAIYKKVTEIPGFMTRYPITGFGSIFPVKNYMKTTTTGLVLDVLADDWKTVLDTVPEFPMRPPTAYVNSMNPATGHLGPMGGDNTKHI